MPLDQSSKSSGLLSRLRLKMRNLFRSSDTARQARSNLALHQVLTARKTGTMPTWAQILHLPKLLSKREKRIGAVALIVFVIAGGLLAHRLFQSQRIVIAANGGDYTEGLVGTPQLVNPLYAIVSDVDNDLSHLVFSGLMRYDSEIGLTTDLAESYEISDDGRVYTFVLREDATWHDGRPVRVSDIIFTLNAIQNPNYRSPLISGFSGIAIEEVDERTVRLTLSEPFSPFLSFLTVGILPSHIWQNINPTSASITELNLKPVGSGPYKFEKYTKDARGNIREYILRRNPDYHLGAPYIERLHFKFYSDVSELVSALRNNNVEGIGYLPPDDIATFERQNGIQILYPSMPQYTALFFNQTRQSILASADVRKALAQATDKNAIVASAIGGHGVPVDSFILEGMIGEHPDIKKYPFDAEAARTALEAAGWTLAEGEQIRTKSGVALRFDLVALNSSELVAAANKIKEQWLTVGADVQIRLVSSTEFQNSTLRNRDFDILLSAELYGIDPDPYVFWHSSQTQFPNLNLAQFASRSADTLIETGRTQTDEEKRAQAYRELQDIVAEAVPAIFLYQPQYPYAIDAKVKGAQIDQIASPSHRFGNVHEWYIRTKKIFGRE